MGTWGSGNLDSDHALNFVDAHVHRLIDHLESQFVPEKLSNENFPHIGDAQIMPALEILLAIGESLDKGIGLEPEDVENWRENYLQAFDRWTADGSYASEEFVQERRHIIVKTFERLVAWIES